MYGSPEVVDAADEAYSAVWQWGHYSDFGRDDDVFYERQDRYHEAESDLLVAIRVDLGLQVWVEDAERDNEPSGRRYRKQTEGL